MKRCFNLAFLRLVSVTALCVARHSAVAMDSDPEVRTGPGVTAIKRLSSYLPSLTNTPGDTAVYFLEGKKLGGTAFVAGGTHANEIAGVMAATVLVEGARVEKGRLIVIVHANNSASTYPDPRNNMPARYALKTASGERQFRFGARMTNPAHQGAPDPLKFRHPSSTEELGGIEARNLDRAYPGRADGNLTERVAWAILQVLKTESVDAAFDLHESPPDSRLAWMIVAHPKSLDLAAAAIVELDAAGAIMRLEHSSETFRGLSHREWGDATKTHAFLFETPNPGMGNKRKGADVVNDPDYPLAKRAGMQLSALLAVLNAYNDSTPPTLAVKIRDVPGVKEVMQSGLGAFLK